MTLRFEVQKQFRSLVEAHQWDRVVYDENEDPEIDKTCKVTGIDVNEVSAEFAPSRRRDKLRLQKTSWVFEARVQLDAEAVIETFEQKLMDDPPFIEDGSGGRALLYLSRCAYEHPVRHTPSNGTRLVIQFNLQPNQ